MVTHTALTEAEYLRTSFDGPEPDFINGELIQRALPNNFHSTVQLRLAVWFGSREQRLGLHPRPELRVRVAPGRYRVGDLVVYSEPPTGEIPQQIPYAAAEIVSPDDRLEEILSKLAEYANWGVKHVWLVDPGLRALYVYSDRSLHAVAAFELPEFQERIPAEEILP